MRPGKKYFIFGLLLFVVFFPVTLYAFEGPVYRLNLQECIDMALRNNEDIKAAHRDIYASLARKIEATKRYIPVVRYHYRIAPVPRDLENPGESFFSGDISVFNTIRIEGGVPLTTFGWIKAQKELADIGIDASELQKIRKADEVVLDIHKLYYGILLARGLKVLAHKGLDAVQKKIEELEKAETTDQLQILKLKAVIYETDKRLDEANTKETIAVAMLKFRIGLEDDAPFDLKDQSLKRASFSDRSFEDLLDQSKEKRPEFKLLIRQVQAKQQQIVIEKKTYYPKLVFAGFFEYGVSPGIVGDETDNDFNNPFNFIKGGAGFELSGDLDFRKIKSKVEFAEAEHLKAIADKRSKFRQLEIDLKDSYLTWQQRKNLLVRAEKEQRSARQIVFLTKSNVDVGIGEKTEYLEALQSYLLIQAAVFENVFNYNVAVATLKQKAGILYQRKLMGEI